MLFLGTISSIQLNVNAADFIQGKPQIVSLKYSKSDVPIVSYNVAEPPYNADSTGQIDATGAIQRAIDDCGNSLGGIVFLPDGKYRIDGNLVLSEGVTLRGDWAEPNASDKTVRGTILCPHNSKGIDSDSLTVESPILLGQSAGIRDLSVYYPEQNAASPVAYPYTIRCKGKMQTVMNVTLVNSYKGIRYEPDNNLALAHPNVRNVYGSPLKKGVRLNKAAAVPRILSLHFTPEYWAESGLPGSPAKDVLKNTMRSLSSVAIEIAQSDNGIIGNVELSGYDTGILIGSGGLDSNMKVYDLNITSCRVGINATNYKIQGWSFTKGIIDVDGSGSMAVIQTGGESFIFHAFSFSSQGSMITSSGGLSLVKCNFGDWGTGNAINMSSGRLIATGNTFNHALAGGQYHIFLSSGVTAAAISGNIFNKSAAKISAQGLDPKKVVIDLNLPSDLYEPNFQPYQFVNYYIPSRQDQNSLFNVKDYGAVGDCVKDNTVAFRAALKAAENYGGGTVYVPGGVYRIDGHVVVPAGVELRGIHDLPHYTGESRSIILSYVDVNTPGDSACISLSANSGIRGFLFVRPQQKYNANQNNTTIYNFPYVIRALGGNTSITNICIANADKGIDLAQTNAGGHKIRWYLTAPLGNCLSVTSGLQPIFIENMQTNPGLFRGVRNEQDWTMFTSDTTVSNELKFVGPLVSESPGLWPYGTAVNVFGNGEVTFYANFYNSPYKGFVITGSPKMRSIISGGEGDNFYSVEEQGPGDIDLEIVGNTYHPISNDNDISFGKFNFSPNSNGKIKILSTISFSAPPIGYFINNGSLIIQSTYQTVSIPKLVETHGNASVSVEGAYLRNGISAYHGLCLSDSSRIRIYGSLSDNSYTVSKNVNVLGSSPSDVFVDGSVNASTTLIAKTVPVIFPNPTDGVFNFKDIPPTLLDEPCDIRIFDITGKMIFYKPSVKLNNSFFLKGTEKGLYFVDISSQGAEFQTKLLIK